ncbi:MAG TPA: glycosyl hydrolase [Candidatus Hydrogenedentes bacterium]|nr:glycosyl hydrolase [Candidatus Hydrogenedentota bacterium]
MSVTLCSIYVFSLLVGEVWAETAPLTPAPQGEPCTLRPLPPETAPLEERFKAPPADSRILKIVHNLPDSPGDQDALLDRLIQQGFGGMVVNVSFQEYMESEAKWEAYIRGVKEANRRGMALWLYDECGYPSGSAGGLTLRDHPEYEARGLNIVDAHVAGGSLSLDLPPGSLFRAVAVPVKDGVASPEGAEDITASVQGTTLAWNAPEGDWHVFLFTESALYEGTHAALSLARKFPYINLLPPEPTARFIEVTHDAYARRLGDDLGRYFAATFTDEPSLMSMFLSEQKHRVLPWASNLALEFQRRRGYEMTPLLPALFIPAGAAGMRFRYDFWKTVGDLVSENFFGQIQAWGRAHNIPSGGHLLAEESFLSHIPLYGNFFQCLRRLDAPSMDCLTSVPESVPWYVARIVSSAAELEGRPLTMSETSDHSQRYRPEGDTRPVRVVTEEEIRGTCNRLMVNGINTITSYYSFSDLDDASMNRLNDWIGRCCTLLRGGRQVADIALLYPVESAWVRFTPATRGVAGSPVKAHRVGKIFHDAENDLYSSGRDFTHVDAQVLAEGRLDGGVLQFRDLHWRVVILPDTDTLPLAAWETLERFYQSGGVVVALTSKPVNSETEFPSPRVLEIAGMLFGGEEEPSMTVNSAGGVGVFLPQGTEALLPTVLDSLLEKDGGVTGGNAPLRMTHRLIGAEHIYFVINDSGQPWEGTMNVPAAGPLEQMDPASGQMTPLDSGHGLSVRLDPYGGMLYRFKDAVPLRRKNVEGGKIPGMAQKPLPEVEPTLSHGQYVNGTIEADAGLSSAERSVWHTSGVLTKGEVDTFLFTCFNYPQPADLSDASYVTVDVWLPQRQKASVPLLVILCDAAGVDYCAQTGVPMNGSGHFCCHVALNHFERAGWCPVKDRPLDATAISTIRIGWGGYLGTENEMVAFSLAAPRLAVIK